MTDFLRDWTPRIYRYALRLTGDGHAAEDLAQETLLRAWRHRDQLRDGDAARVWLFRIATNLWRDQLRRSRSPVGSAKALPIDELLPGRIPQDYLADQEELRQVLLALEKLPDRQREVLYLHACEEMPLAEIASVLGITPDAAKASLSLARKKMRETLLREIALDSGNPGLP